MVGLTGMEKSRNHRMIVMALGSGWAAVEIADYEDMSWGPDITQIGTDRYATAEEAKVEAKEIAATQGIPFVDQGGA